MNLADLTKLPPAGKLAHVLAGVALFALFHFVMPYGLAISMVALVAAGKEYVLDRHSLHHTADASDAAATIAGGVLGFLCGV